MTGRVYIVGAGPGAADLLTLRAVRVLEAADVVFHDALISSEVLALAAKARTVAVGKRCGRHSTAQHFINKRLADAARSHDVVVRLKGGDPMLFGRAHEEISYSARAGHRGRGRAGRDRGARGERRARRIAHPARNGALGRVRHAAGGRRRAREQLGRRGARRRQRGDLHGRRRGCGDLLRSDRRRASPPIRRSRSSRTPLYPATGFSTRPCASCPRSEPGAARRLSCWARCTGKR